MPILVDELSVWDISFRWAGYDPRKFYFRIPLEVENNFRNLIDAIINANLGCVSISLEKRKYESHEKDFSVYYWLDDIYSCLGGSYFNKKLLRHALIGRYDFKLWCDRMSIPLPEFWFPQGWNLEYELPENEIKPGYGYQLKDWSHEARQAYFDTQEQTDLDSESNNKSPQKLKANQEACIACQQVARTIWKFDPTRTIASVVKDELIQKHCDAGRYANETVREWVRLVAPAHISNHRGRPRKNGAEDK